MTKQSFRRNTLAPSEKPSYPTIDEAGCNRRAFLGRLGLLGATLLGAGALAACGDRPVQNHEPVPDGGPEPDELTHTAGVARQPDAGADLRRLEPDQQIMGGVAPALDAAIDSDSE